MKDAILADRPLLEIGPKTYLYEADIVALAHAADRASGEHDVTMVFTSLILEARAVVDSVEHILVCVLRLDPIRPDRGITDILPEALVEAGIRIVMPNHAEHPITFTMLEKTMQRAAEVELTTAMYTNSLAEVRVMASLSPDLLVAESTELIGTGKLSGFDYIEASNRAVREIDPGVCVLQGTEISTLADVETVIRSGADATGSSSAIATAPNPSVMTETMIRTARRGWDTHPRS